MGDVAKLLSRKRPGTRAVLPGGTDLPEGDEKVRAVRAMFDRIAPRYDILNRILTFGLDRGWRREAIAALQLPIGSKVLDLACGTGDLCRELVAARHWGVGVDLSLGMLAHARTSSPLLQADALRLPVPDGVFDGAVSGFALRNFVELDGFFAEVARALRPGGRVSFLDVGQPRGRLLRWGHDLYFARVVPVIGGAVSDRSAYRYLPRSVAYLPPPEDLLARMESAGLVAARRFPLSGGIAQLITATRRP